MPPRLCILTHRAATAVQTASENGFTADCPLTPSAASSPAFEHLQSMYVWNLARIVQTKTVQLTRRLCTGLVNYRSETWRAVGGRGAAGFRLLRTGMPTTGTKRRSECEGPAVDLEELPSAIAVEADFSLYCAGEPHPMDVERGEARCSCDRCSRWDRFVRGEDPGGWPRYEVITAELVAGLAAWLRGEPRSRL